MIRVTVAAIVLLLVSSTAKAQSNEGLDVPDREERTEFPKPDAKQSFGDDISPVPEVSTNTEATSLDDNAASPKGSNRAPATTSTKPEPKSSLLESESTSSKRILAEGLRSDPSSQGVDQEATGSDEPAPRQKAVPAKTNEEVGHLEDATETPAESVVPEKKPSADLEIADQEEGLLARPEMRDPSFDVRNAEQLISAAVRDLAKGEVSKKFSSKVVGNIFWIFLFLAVVWLTNWLRRRLLEHGALPIFLRACAGVFWFIISVLILHFASLVLAELLGFAFGYTFVAVFVFSAVFFRESIADIYARVSFVGEQRRSRGMVLRSDKAEGTIRSVGLRSTLLEEPSGALLRVRNSDAARMVVVKDVADDYHTIAVRLPSTVLFVHPRQVLKDASLMSSYARPGTDVVVRQDPTDPCQWSVSLALLPRRGAAANFRGQLLELVTEIVQALDNGHSFASEREHNPSRGTQSAEDT